MQTQTMIQTELASDFYNIFSGKPTPLVRLERDEAAGWEKYGHLHPNHLLHQGAELIYDAIMYAADRVLKERKAI